MFTEEYIKKCEKLKQLQKSWKPQVGDWVFRKYDIFGEEIDKKIWPNKDQREDLIVLTFQSTADGYFHASDGKGNTRIFKQDEKFFKSTCIFVPTMKRLFGILGLETDDEDGEIGFFRLLEMIRFVECYFCDYDDIAGCDSSDDDFYWRQFSLDEFVLAYVGLKKWKKIWVRDKKKWKSVPKKMRESVGLV